MHNGQYVHSEEAERTKFHVLGTLKDLGIIEG